MELTKEQRRKIYKECLKEIPEGIGLCAMLDMYFEELFVDLYFEYDEYFYVNRSGLIKSAFPEMEMIRPKYARWKRFWWPKDDIDSRKEALKKMVELTWN